MSAADAIPVDREHGGHPVVEPGGVEPIPAAGRRGHPGLLFWTWAAPNLRFATVLVGVLSVQVAGLTFAQAAAAVLLGNGLAALAHGVFSARGRAAGVPQMVLGRLAFGRVAALPSALTAVTAGLGWAVVNAVTAALALGALTGLPAVRCLAAVALVQTGVAFFGHDAVQAFARWTFPVLAAVLAVGAVLVLLRSDPAFVPVGGGTGGVGGFLLTVGAAFGFTAAWTPYAADHSRYLPADVSPLRTGLAAGLGLFSSTTVLMVVGAASVSASALAGVAPDNPAAAFAGVLPGVLVGLTLLAFALGAVAAGVLNLHSGALAFLATGVPVPLRWARAVAVLVFGAAAYGVALLVTGDAAGYADLVLVVAHWVGPWLGVVLTDQLLRRGRLLPDRGHGLAGVIALAAGLVPLFVPGLGGAAVLAGTVVSAAVYASLFPRLARR